MINGKFTSRNFTIHDLIERKMLTEPQAEQLADSIQHGDNLLISGATSPGKSTLLNVLAGYRRDDDGSRSVLIGLCSHWCSLHVRCDRRFHSDNQRYIQIEFL